MTLVFEAALGGYGIALAVGWASKRLEGWWHPTWRATARAFAAARTTAPVAALAAVTAAATTGASIVAVAASGTTAWLIAQGYVMLLVAARG